MKKAVFIDRDGILNELDPERPKWIPKDVTQFKVTPGIRPLLKKLCDTGFMLIVTTHQPGLSDGSLPRKTLDRMHEILISLKLVDDIVVCPHKTDEKCACCPPMPALFQEVAHRHSLTLHYCFAVSTRWQEMEAIKAVGGIPIQIASPKNAKNSALTTVKNFEEAVNKIIEMNKKNPS
jgi:histidinol-phosphate phosphatase family protein